MKTKVLSHLTKTMRHHMRTITLVALKSICDDRKYDADHIKGLCPYYQV